jgi:DNA-binding protein HU-beta
MAKVSSRRRTVHESDSASREAAETVGDALNFPAGKLMDAMVRELKKAGRFTLPGFGTFTIRGIRARTKPGPGHLDQIDVRGVRTVRFEASPTLRKAIEAVDPGAIGRRRDIAGETPRVGEIDDPMARQLREPFAEAARQAVRRAHAEGLAVPARTDGVAVEIRPDGKVVRIDDNAPWSPTDWRTSAKR